MGRLLERALERAGLSEIRARALAGRGLPDPDLARLRGEDALLVAGLADAVRAHFFGDDVRVLSNDAARREPGLLRPSFVGSGAQGITGQELLIEIAFARLAAPADRSLCVSFDALGLQLAQVALAFGADALCGDLAGKRVLPLLDGPGARRVELQGLLERAGRGVRFVDPQPPALESRS